MVSVVWCHFPVCQEYNTWLTWIWNRFVRQAKSPCQTTASVSDTTQALQMQQESQCCTNVVMLQFHLFQRHDHSSLFPARAKPWSTARPNIPSLAHTGNQWIKLGVAEDPWPVKIASSQYAQWKGQLANIGRTEAGTGQFCHLTFMLTNKLQRIVVADSKCWGAIHSHRLVSGYFWWSNLVANWYWNVPRQQTNLLADQKRDGLWLLISGNPPVGQQLLSEQWCSAISPWGTSTGFSSQPWQEEECYWLFSSADIKPKR